MLANLGPLAAAAVLSVVLARAIGPEGNGIFALVLTMVNVAVLVFSFGLSAGITYEVSRGRWPLRRALTETYVVAIVLGLGAAGVGYGFYELTRDSALRSVDLDLALIGLAAIPSFLAWQFGAAILVARDRYEDYAVLQLTSALVMLLVGAGLALPFELTGAVIGLTASGVVTALVGAWRLRRLMNRGAEAAAVSGPSRRFEHLRRAFPFGFQAWVANILQQANYRLDLLVLGAYAAASEVGKYSVALTVTSLAWILPNGLQTVVFPRTARLDADAETGTLSAAESDEAVSRATRHGVLLTLPAALTVVLLLIAVPPIYGGEFRETVGLGLVLLPGVLALGVGKVLGAVVAGRGKPSYMTYSGVIGAAATVTMYFLLIPPYEEWGAAAASSASYLLTTIVVYWFFRRATGISGRASLVPTRADVRNYREALDAFRAHRRNRRDERPA